MNEAKKLLAQAGSLQFIVRPPQRGLTKISCASASPLVKVGRPRPAVKVLSVRASLNVCCHSRRQVLLGRTRQVDQKPGGDQERNVAKQRAVTHDGAARQVEAPRPRAGARMVASVRQFLKLGDAAGGGRVCAVVLLDLQADGRPNGVGLA